MRYLAIEVADCGEEPLSETLDRLVQDLEDNYPIVVHVKQVVLDTESFEEVERLTH